MNKQQEISDVIDNLRRVVQAIRQHSRVAEKGTGLTGPQLWALKILAGSSPLRLSELAHRMYLQPATVVGIIDRLEARNLVSRLRCREDRRAVDLALTPAGELVAAQAPEVAQVMLLEGLERLSREELGQAAEGMQVIVKILGAESITPQPLHG